jgi:uncharacterized protein
VTKCGVRKDELARGIELFNEEHFFEAHEVLEDVWRDAPSAEKRFLQGLVQLAVAFHHHSTGNRVGSHSVMARALGNISSHPEGLHNLHTREIVESVAPFLHALEQHRPFGKLPKLKMHG